MTTRNESLTSRSWFPLVAVLILTGAVGFYLGAVRFGDWQLSVESAQVLAGVVPYPVTNITYIFQIKLWSLINQIPALLLHLNVSEINLSLAISGLIGMLVFQALAFLVWAFSRNSFLAFAAPFVIFLYITGGYQLSEQNRAFDSTVYPIYFMNIGHTYGALSLPYVLMIFSAYGAGLYGLGSLLLGLAPAIHSSSGVWCLIIFPLAFLWHARQLETHWRRIALFFMAGAAISGASLLIHMYLTGAVQLPVLARELKRNYLLNFIANADLHRQPVQLKSWGMFGHLSFLLFLGSWLVRNRERLTTSVALLVKALLVTASLSLLFAILSQMPEILPMELLIAMPGRLQNIVLLAFPAVLMGLLGAPEGGQAERLLLACLLVAMMAAQILHLPLDGAIIPATTALAATLLLNLRGLTSATGQTTKILDGGVLLLGGLAVILSFTVVLLGPHTWQTTKERFHDWSNDGALARMRIKSGMLLTGSNIYPVQIMTRRPVLLNGGFLNFVSYIPEMAPEMDSILKKVYGVDLFTTHQAVKRPHGLFRNDGKALWEARTRREWQELGREFGFTNVLVYQDWHLDLPAEIPFGPCMFYKIPE
jgi:hypothetical protein